MDTKLFIEVSMFVIAVGGIVGAVFKARGMDEAQQRSVDKEIDALKAVHTTQWQAIDKNRREIELRKEETWKVKGELELQISEVKGFVGKLDGKFDNILASINDLKKDISNRLDKIESTISRN